MRFVSTNGRCPAVGFREALLRGLAPDGGLYVPERLPLLPASFLESLRSKSLHDIGEEVLTLFVNDLSPAEMKQIVERAWTFPLPVVKLEEGLFLLELFHGPTLAFKDIGARFMAAILSHYLAREHRTLTILVATSGDTGSAVAHGFFDTPNITVNVLYPSGKISHLQEQQMTTLGGNIVALEVEGTFDDCQRLVKQALADEELLRARGVSTANSINVARLLPQAVYYVWAAAQLQGIHGIVEAPAVVVPSGNVGNLTAALYAKHLGAPLGPLVAATNANTVVPEYLASGTFSPRPSVVTLSNAMDVGNPSNLARVQALFGGNVERMRKELSALNVTDEETLRQMRETFDRTGTVLDPHTAVGVAVARRFRHTSSSSSPLLVAATAHPGKFPEVVLRALGKTFPPPPQLEEALGKPKRSIRLTPDYKRFKAFLLSEE